MNKGKTVLAWILRLGLAALFLMSASGKLSSSPAMVALFDAIGIGRWFLYFTGAFEVASAIALLIPRTTWLGALGLIATMIGAIITHAFIVGGSFAMPAVLLAASLVLFALTVPKDLLARLRGFSERHA